MACGERRSTMRFRCHLIGIDPDYGNYVSDRLLESHHDLFLELGRLKGIPRNADR
jgi:hypothetical protein